MRLYIAGIQGMVGSAIARLGKSLGFEILGQSSQHLNFTNREAVFEEMKRLKPDALLISAAKVGGIGANSSHPVDFLSLNLQIQTNLMDASHNAGVTKVLFLGSSCIYPKFASQPIQESSLLTGQLEETNSAYAVAKIAGVKLIESYRQQFGHKWISAMPTNLYGPGDNFNLETGHVLPSLIHRFHNAKIHKESAVSIWGDGTPLREFLHVDDLASACMVLLDKYDDSVAINVGSGEEVSISNLAKLIAQIVGYEGIIQCDITKPNGTPRKFLDSSKIFSLGWGPKILLEDGIALTYDCFKSTLKSGDL